jgi:hypothetical protein
VQLLVSLQCLLQDYDLLLALNPTSSRIRLTLAITLHAVKLHHLFYTLEVLLLNIQLELDLRQHELDTGAEVGVVVFDKIYTVV